MTPRSVAEQWYNRAATVGHGHYRAAMRYSRLNFWFGLPAVVLATVVGTSVFASLQAQPGLVWQLLVGTMSIAAAILSAMQSFLGYSDKAERHRVAGSRYNSVGRELEQWLSLPEEDLPKLDGIRLRIDALAQESPHIPESVHREIPKKLDELTWKEPRK